MNEGRAISMGTVVTGCLWAWVAALLLASWGTWLLSDHTTLPILLGLTACASSAAAATAQVRCYAVRLCRVVRVTGGLQRPEADVRDFPPRP